MSAQIRHIVQPYDLVTQRGRGSSLVPGEALSVRSAAAAKQRAETLYATRRHVGVDAYTVKVDEEAGEYGDPVFHARLGQVPDYEG